MDLATDKGQQRRSVAGRVRWHGSGVVSVCSALGMVIVAPSLVLDTPTRAVRGMTVAYGPIRDNRDGDGDGTMVALT